MTLVASLKNEDNDLHIPYDISNIIGKDIGSRWFAAAVSLLLANVGTTSINVLKM